MDRRLTSIILLAILALATIPTAGAASAGGIVCVYREDPIEKTRPHIMPECGPTVIAGASIGYDGRALTICSDEECNIQIRIVLHLL